MRAYYKFTDRHCENIREGAIARGATGFLHPVCDYVVICGTDRVHAGKNKREAVHCFRRHCRWSGEGNGKAAGQTVRLLKDGEQIEIYTP